MRALLLVCLMFVGCGEKGPTKAELIQEYEYELKQLETLTAKRDHDLDFLRNARINERTIIRGRILDSVRSEHPEKSSGEHDSIVDKKMKDFDTKELNENTSKITDMYKEIIGIKKKTVDELKSRIDAMP